ncbi:MAG: type IV secretory system conjugative DNA transfer family protein, partial [Actinomycetes bacterium]
EQVLADLIPTAATLQDHGSEVRAPMAAAGHLRLRPHDQSLSTTQPVSTAVALLSALTPKLAGSEELVLQLVIGPRRQPCVTPENAGCAQSLWEAALGREPTKSTERAALVKQRNSEHGALATVRIGAAAKTSVRRRALVMGVMNALCTMRSPGLRIDLVRENPTGIDQGRAPWRWPLRLGVSELVNLVAWPLGDGELPGLPPLHPRQLPIPVAAMTHQRVFAASGTGSESVPVGLNPKDGLFHTVALGPSGSGKSNAFLHLIRADIAAGRPIVVIDPKQQLIDSILECIPEDQVDRVVVMDASDSSVVGFNPLDTTGRDPDLVVDAIVAALRVIFRDGWGPRTQEIIHSGLLTLARASASRDEPFTLLDLPRLLTEISFRRSVIGHVAEDPALGPFWAAYEAMSPGAQANIISAPLNKLRQYLIRPNLRKVLGQSQPGFRLRDVFTEGKIVLIPLNEAVVGPLAAQLLGSLIVADLWLATLARASENQPTQRHASIFLDEFVQFMHLPLSIADALAQSRSMGVGWYLAHQFRDQLSPTVRAAVDTNAQSKIVFRLGPDDARDLAKQAPDLVAEDFQSLGRYQAYVNLIVDGSPSGWFSARTLPPPQPISDPHRIRAISRDRYGSTVPGEHKGSAAGLGAAAMRAATNQSPTGADGRIGRRRRQS